MLANWRTLRCAAGCWPVSECMSLGRFVEPVNCLALDSKCELEAIISKHQERFGTHIFSAKSK